MNPSSFHVQKDLKAKTLDNHNGNTYKSSPQPAAMHPQLIICETSVLKLCKFPIKETLALAQHYYLSEHNDFQHSLGWGPQGIEVRGKVRVTEKESERVQSFMQAARYSIAVNNCEHFANYVLHGLNISHQVSDWWKELGAEVIAMLQPTQTRSENISDHIGRQVSEIFKENLRKVKIDKANQSRIDFWRERGIDVQ